jgi:RNA polymerase sigma-70 factor (ECF subfamily)
MDEDTHRGGPGPRLVPRAESHPSSDEGLVAEFLQGDDGAFGRLCARHEALVRSVVRRYARSPEDARDLAQRTFLRALQAMRRTARARAGAAVPGAFRRWLVRIALNLAKNHARDEVRAARVRLEALGPAEGREAEAPSLLVRRERERRVRVAVAALPRRQREVLTLRVDAELPFAEIARALGITENAAKVSFHHATRALRALAAEEDVP